MHYLTALLHTFGVTTVDKARDTMRVAADDGERGNVTIEQVIWAVAIIGIVAIVTGAITRFVTTTAADIT